MIRVGRIVIDEAAIEESFVRAPGPGGQNVNKVATAVELRFHTRRAEGLTAEARLRLRRLAGRRWTFNDEIVITASRFRSQERNRQDARERLTQLVIEALQAPKARVATRPSPGSRRQRLEGKRRRGQTKELRRKPDQAI